MKALRHLVPHPFLSLAIPVVWILLLNTVSPGAILVGIILGIGLPFYTRRFWPQRLRMRQPWRLAAYASVVLLDIVLANIDVIRLVLFRRARSLRPAFVSVPLDIETPEAILIFVATISLTPGTIGADLSADGRAILVHGLDVPDPDGLVRELKDRYERRLLEIFG